MHKHCKGRILIKNIIFLRTQLKLEFSLMQTSEKTQDHTPTNPSLLSSGGKFGLKGAKYFGLVIVIIGIINTLFLIISFFTFSEIPNPKYLGFILVVVALGVLFTAVSMYFTYKYLLTDGISVLYNHAAPFFRKLSTFIIDKIENIAVDKMHIKDTHIEKAFNVGNMLTEIYGNKIPGIAQKGITYLVNQIPFTDLILNIKDSIKERDQEKASISLYNEIDFYIKTSILGKNSMKWLYWMIPLNIVFQIILMYCLKSFFV